MSDYKTQEILVYSKNFKRVFEMKLGKDYLNDHYIMYIRNIHLNRKEEFDKYTATPTYAYYLNSFLSSYIEGLRYRTMS